MGETPFESNEVHLTVREVSQREVKFSAMPKGANLPDG